MKIIECDINMILKFVLIIQIETGVELHIFVTEYKHKFDTPVKM